MANDRPRLMRLVKAGANPAPYPPDTRSRGWYFPIDLSRIRQSKAWALCGTVIGLRNVLLRLWIESWDQIPMGSLPDDDEVIAAVVEYPLGMFIEHRSRLMHGWGMADDGRFYHGYITELVLGRMAHTKDAAARKAKWRENRQLQPHDSFRADAMSHNVPRDMRQVDAAGAGAGAGAMSLPLVSLELQEPLSFVGNGVQGKTLAARATRLPPDWQLPDEWKAFAVNVHRLDPQRVVRISLVFRDHWVAIPGAKGCKLDWLATWRNWIRRECGNA